MTSISLSSIICDAAVGTFHEVEFDVIHIRFDTSGCIAVGELYVPMSRKLLVVYTTDTFFSKKLVT